MSDDERRASAAELLEYPKGREDTEAPHPLPYYWSWYGLVFTDPGGEAGARTLHSVTPRGDEE